VRPQLAASAPCLSKAKRDLFRGPKIVVAGMSRRLEAAYDAGGTALGVQVYAVSRPEVDPRYLLAVLNSRLVSQLFRQRFAAKRLGGGYLAINKRQLSQLPIRRMDLARRDERRAHDRLLQLVDRMTRLCRSRGDEQDRRDTAAAAECGRVDAEIDALVARLYDVRERELAA
jgi:hypothetical protein